MQVLENGSHLANCEQLFRLQAPKSSKSFAYYGHHQNLLTLRLITRHSILFELSWANYTCLHGTKYSRMDQVNFFKGCPPQRLSFILEYFVPHVISGDCNSFVSYIFWIKVAILKCSMRTWYYCMWYFFYRLQNIS